MTRNKIEPNLFIKDNLTKKISLKCNNYDKIYMIKQTEIEIM